MVEIINISIEWNSIILDVLYIKGFIKVYT